MAEQDLPARDPQCRVSDVLDVFKGRWKGEIIRLLSDQSMRFSELKSSLRQPSSRVLTESLRALERDGVLIRHEVERLPPHVEYALSDSGLQLVPLLDEIRAWGAQHLKCVRAHREQYDRTRG